MRSSQWLLINTLLLWAASDFSLSLHLLQYGSAALCKAPICPEKCPPAITFQYRVLQDRESGAPLLSVGTLCSNRRKDCPPARNLRRSGFSIQVAAFQLIEAPLGLTHGSRVEGGTGRRFLGFVGPRGRPECLGRCLKDSDEITLMDPRGRILPTVSMLHPEEDLFP